MMQQKDLIKEAVESTAVDQYPEIFKGLKVEEKVARELARYSAAAGNVCGLIDVYGNLTTHYGTWKRPISGDSYITLRDGLDGQHVDFILVAPSAVFVDFKSLEYNLDWIAQTIREGQHGVADTNKGLRLYCRRPAHDGAWYDDSFAWWPFYGVTVKMLQDMGCLTRSAGVRTSPINGASGNDMEVLYFAD